jgi:hypothetical protein
MKFASQGRGKPFPMIMSNVSGHTRVPRARWTKVHRVLTLAVFVMCCGAPVSAAVYESPNFIVTASSEPIARQMAELAEESRLAFAREWFHEVPADWSVPCRVQVNDRSTRGHGWTNVDRDRGRIDALEIVVSGGLDLIADYLLPHEVAHVVLATSLDRPIARWADEGLAMLSESASEKMRQRKRAAEYAASQQIMSLNDVLQLVAYPERYRDVVGFYISSFSLTEYLVARGGKKCLLSFIIDGEQFGWEESARRHYASTLADLEAGWTSSLTEANAAETIADLATLRAP